MSEQDATQREQSRGPEGADILRLQAWPCLWPPGTRPGLWPLWTLTSCSIVCMTLSFVAAPPALKVSIIEPWESQPRKGGLRSPQEGAGRE